MYCQDRVFGWSLIVFTISTTFPTPALPDDIWLLMYCWGWWCIFHAAQFTHTTTRTASSSSPTPIASSRHTLSRSGYSSSATCATLKVKKDVNRLFSVYALILVVSDSVIIWLRLVVWVLVRIDLDRVYTIGKTYSGFEPRTRLIQSLPLVDIKAFIDVPMQKNWSLYKNLESVCVWEKVYK